MMKKKKEKHFLPPPKGLIFAVDISFLNLICRESKFIDSLKNLP